MKFNHEDFEFIFTSIAACYLYIGQPMSNPSPSVLANHLQFHGLLSSNTHGLKNFSILNILPRNYLKLLRIGIESGKYCILRWGRLNFKGEYVSFSKHESIRLALACRTSKSWILASTRFTGPPRSPGKKISPAGA